MANPTYYSSLIRPEQMNSGKGYRVHFSYGTFSIAAKVTQSGVYYYAHKRVDGKLYKTYVGKCGEVTHRLLHQATMKLSNRIYNELGIVPN